MSAPVQMITIITPKPGKIQEVIDTLEPYNTYVEASETGTLRYELFKQMNGDTEVLVYAEVFKDMAAVENHRVSTEHVDLLRKAAEDDLLASPPDTMILGHVGGFALRK